jgi:hypothetical protein
MPSPRYLYRTPMIRTSFFGIRLCGVRLCVSMEKNQGEFVLLGIMSAVLNLGHSEIVKDGPYILRELSHFLSDTANTFGFDDTDCEST